MSLAVNGRFLGQPLSGVQRFAHEVLAALDLALLQAGQTEPVPVFHPKGAAFATPLWQVLHPVAIGPGQGHLWEQTALWAATRQHSLLSLCGSGPVLHRRQILVCHDAHVWDHPEGFEPAYRLWHRALRPVLSRRAVVPVTVSAYSASRLARHTGVPQEDWQIIPNAPGHLTEGPADTAVFEGLDLSRGYLLCVGNQSPIKNLTRLARVYGQLGTPLPLVVVGSSVPGVQFIDVDKDVLRLGAVSDAALRALYRNATGFVCPSLSEGFGIPPLEAMAAGVPVAASTGGALPEVLGAAPIYFDPRSDNEMRLAIVELLSMSAKERMARISSGLSHAQSFDWGKSAATLLALLQKAGALGSGGTQHTADGAPQQS